jgi:hypothetical protein
VVAVAVAVAVVSLTCEAVSLHRHCRVPASGHGFLPPTRLTGPVRCRA